MHSETSHSFYLHLIMWNNNILYITCIKLIGDFAENKNWISKFCQMIFRLNWQMHIFHWRFLKGSIVKSYFSTIWEYYMNVEFIERSLGYKTISFNTNASDILDWFWWLIFTWQCLCYSDLREYSLFHFWLFYLGCSRSIYGAAILKNELEQNKFSLLR